MTSWRVPAAGVCLALVSLAAAQDTKPLPDAATFLADAKKLLASDERLQVQYTYKLRRTDVGRNPFGRIGTGDIKLFEVYPSPIAELTYYRLIETNGVRTPDRELAAQDRKQREKVDDYVSRLRRESPADRRRRLEQDSIVGSRERAMVNDVVESLDYRLERREAVDGRPAIVVAFSPKPSAKPVTAEGKLVKHFTGRVWVDEQEKHVARVEAEAIDELTYGFGLLVRIDAGMKGAFTRRKTPEGVWLPSQARLVGAGRALVFRRFDLNLVSEYFEYRPIDPLSPPPFVALPSDVMRDESAAIPHE
jgi:hypothetical protein